VVEGSLADTSVEKEADGLRLRVHCPAILVGVRGGGTSLPAQRQCLDLLLKPKTKLHPCRQLAESIGAAVLAGELSLLAAQASHQMAKSHQSLAR
jgi:hydroxymethylglutaryl-CoA reductase (NADPH)